jgi:predicted transcriptional regulator
MGRVKADWVAIEPLYRAGVKSVNELARENGLTEGAIRKHAKKHEWKRDLTEKVRARTREMLVQDLAGTKDGTKDDGTNVQRAPLSERVTVEQGALTQIGVLREQRKTIGNGHKLTLRLLDELDTATTHVGELEKLITTSTDDAKKRNAMLKAASAFPT